MTIYKLAFAFLISAGFTVPSWGMGDEEKKDNSTVVSTVAPHNSEAIQQLVPKLVYAYYRPGRPGKFFTT